MSTDFREQLSQDSLSWVKEGFISEDQRASILSRYPEGAPQKKRLNATIATLGSLLVGVGIILFFASNWQSISPFRKMALLMATLLGSYGLGFWLFNAKESSPRMARSFWFLGAILYGANIFLVAQAYNISAHWPNGVLWWALGLLPLAFLLSSRAMIALALGALSFWMGSEMFLAMKYGKASMSAFSLAYLFWGCGLWGLGRWLRTLPGLDRTTPVFQWFGLLFLLAGAYPFTFKGIHDSGIILLEAFAGKELVLSFCIGSTVALIISAAAILRTETGRQDWRLVAWILAVAAWGWLLGFILTPGAAVTAVLANIAYFGGLIALLYFGYLHSADHCVNLGLVAFAALVIGRYFDFAWQYMERSAAFIVGGLLLLLLGFGLERGRRKLLGGRADA
ncbi:DUF2157 domain-containing protein [Elusimicrobiota bacterium]